MCAQVTTEISDINAQTFPNYAYFGQLSRGKVYFDATACHLVVALARTDNIMTDDGHVRSDFYEFTIDLETPDISLVEYSETVDNWQEGGTKITNTNVNKGPELASFYYKDGMNTCENAQFQLVLHSTQTQLYEAVSDRIVYELDATAIPSTYNHVFFATLSSTTSSEATQCCSLGGSPITWNVHDIPTGK